MSTSIRAAIAATLLLSSIGTAGAEGFYFGAGWNKSSIGGDFDGENIFGNGSEVIVVPKIDSGSGFAFFGGIHATENWDLEMSYYSSDHNADWLGIDFDVEYTSLNFDAKYNFETGNENLKPYGLFGFGFGTVTVVGGSSDGFSLGDAKYYGSGLNLGIGVNYYVKPEVSFGVAYIMRLTSYDEAEGISGTRGALPSDLDGDATTFTINATYHILH